MIKVNDVFFNFIHFIKSSYFMAIIRLDALYSNCLFVNLGMNFLNRAICHYFVCMTLIKRLKKSHKQFLAGVDVKNVMRCVKLFLMNQGRGLRKNF